ncbi:nicotinate (nicotinamide) nucleotide adenylyltransferase [Candidatus Saccharibacteria bacterium]|nr:nicotinate (nicotinamide) nucleotide adenylyltransferase [Candidatus Saccharibacteria bacterium]
MKKIGIFSGTFDPVHEGHISFAREALKQFKLDKVFFLVEPRPRRKQGVKAFDHRVHMVRQALRKQPRMGMIVLGQARFTPHETLPVLKARFKGAQLYMLMGEDMLDHLADWPHIKDLVQAVHFVIGIRRQSATDIRKLLDNLNQTRGLHFHCDIFRAKDSETSSSSVRSALRKGQSPAGLNPSVLRYIRRHNLYSFPTN